jgi:hypothetical protein
MATIDERDVDVGVVDEAVRETPFPIAPAPTTR